MKKELVPQESSLAFSNLTQSQLLFWTGQKLNPDAPMYNMALAFDLRGAINSTCFQQAFQKLVDQCDAMRTVFEVENGAPRQRVLAEFPYLLEILDWTDNPAAEAYFETWVKERCQKTLDLLECGFDAVLIKINSELFIWYLNQHHLITDAWAVSVQYKAMAEIV